MSNEVKKDSIFNKFLLAIEKYGNKIPQPTTLFVFLAVAVVILSDIMSRLGSSVSLEMLDPSSGMLQVTTVNANSLLSANGIRYMLENAVTNFTSFAPVGVVLVTLFGISAADGTGLLRALVRKVLFGVSQKALIPVIIFVGVMSNIASDAGYVMVLPLAGMIFSALGKNPLIGIAAGFYGVSAGFSANLLIGSIDPLLGGLTSVGAEKISAGYYVSPMANYYFMFTSTFLIVLVGTVVNNVFIEKNFKNREFEASDEKVNPVNKQEKRGLKFALITLVVFIGLVLLAVLPENGVLQNNETGSILTNSPFINSIVIIIALLFFFTGLAYGVGAKTISSDKDLLNSMEPMINTMGNYLILTFVAAQFVSYFAYSNIGTIFAVNGAEGLKSTGLTGIPLLVVFIFICAFINLFVGSAVTKWSVMASVFVPMFMMLDITPELTQLAYRIGDSTTNIISPLMPFFGVVLLIANRFDKKVGMGSIISMMIPYSLTLLVIWVVFFIIWILLGIPIGPGVSFYL